MIEETGRVVRIEADALWVETISRSSCGQCAARTGCGQASLATWLSRANLLRVSAPGATRRYQLDQQVVLGIDEAALAKASLLIYLLPLLFLLAGALLAGHGRPDWVAAVGAILGFVAGAALARNLSRRLQTNPRYHPVLVRAAASAP